MFCALTAEGATMISHVGTLWTDTNARAGLAVQTGIVFEVRESDIALNTMTLHFFGDGGWIFGERESNLAE